MILLHSLLEYPLWYGPFQMAFGLGIGLLLWQPKALSLPKTRAASENSRSNKPLASVLYALLAIMLIAFATYAAWDLLESLSPIGAVVIRCNCQQSDEVAVPVGGGSARLRNPK